MQDFDSPSQLSTPRQYTPLHTPRSEPSEESRHRVACGLDVSDFEARDNLSLVQSGMGVGKGREGLGHLVFGSKTGTQVWASPNNARVILTGADGKLHEVNLSAESVALC